MAPDTTTPPGSGAPPTIFPRELLSYWVGQCAVCGRLTIQGPPLSEVLADRYRLNKDIRAIEIVRALEVHLRHTCVDDCAACWAMREAKNLRENGKACLPDLYDTDAEDVLKLYLSPGYKSVEDKERTRLRAASVVFAGGRPAKAGEPKQ